MVPPSHEEQDNMIRSFITATSKKNIRIVICGSCAQESTESHTTVVPLKDLPNRELLRPTTPHAAQKLHEGILLCKEAISENGRSVRICDACWESLKKGETPQLSLANDMWIGEIPYELQNLHLAERLMISKGFPSAYIFKLYPKKKGAAQWGTESQFYNGLKGNVTTYKMDPIQMASVLCDNIFPHHPSVLSAVIGVTFVGPKGSPLYGLPGMFKVRRWRIRGALLWLKSNNPLYSDIVISEERLSAFPEDDIPEELLLTAKFSSDVESLNREGEGYVPDLLDEDDEGTYLLYNI